MSETITVDFTKLEQMLRLSIIPNGDAAIIEGPPGCGKTQTFFTLARSLQAENENFGASYENMGAAELMKGIGTPKNSDNRFSQTGIPSWMMPNEKEGLRGVFRKLYDPAAHDLKSVLNSTVALDPYPEGIVCLDEVQTSPDAGYRLGQSEFWCEAKFGDWQLPPGWARIGFTNSIAHRSGVKPFFMHARNRVLMLKVRPSLTDQLNYWRNREIPFREEFALFAMSEPDLVLSQEVPAEDRQWSTARSWDKAEAGAMTWMQNGLGLDPDSDPLPVRDHAFCAFIAGRVGEGVLHSFLTFLTDMAALPTYDDIKASPSGVKIPADPMKQLKMVNLMSYSAEYADLQILIECARRLDKPIAGIFGANIGRRFGSSVARQVWFLNFMDWCGHGAKLQLNA